jgi:hypothetical protein
MKRFTIRNSYGTVSQPVDLKWDEALERLAAYEDTGLTPEELHELLHDSTGPLHEKLGEWIDVERDGRLLIQPCKERDQVWAIVSVKGRSFVKYGRAQRIRYNADTKCWLIKIDHYKEKIFGETIFLSREEAKAVLAEMVERGDAQIEK